MTNAQRHRSCLCHRCRCICHRCRYCNFCHQRCPLGIYCHYRPWQRRHQSLLRFEWLAGSSRRRYGAKRWKNRYSRRHSRYWKRIRNAFAYRGCKIGTVYRPFGLFCIVRIAEPLQGFGTYCVLDAPFFLFRNILWQMGRRHTHENCGGKKSETVIRYLSGDFQDSKRIVRRDIILKYPFAEKRKGIFFLFLA